MNASRADSVLSGGVAPLPAQTQLSLAKAQNQARCPALLSFKILRSPPPPLWLFVLDVEVRAKRLRLHFYRRRAANVKLSLLSPERYRQGVRWRLRLESVFDVSLKVLYAPKLGLAPIQREVLAPCQGREFCVNAVTKFTGKLCEPSPTHQPGEITRVNYESRVAQR